MANTRTARNILCPFFVILDLKLPGMMGLQLLKWIRSRRDLRLIPIVVLTGSEDDVDVKSAYEAGANSYLQAWRAGRDFSGHRSGAGVLASPEHLATCPSRKMD